MRSSNDRIRGGALIQPVVILAALVWLASFATAAGLLARRRDRLVPLWAIYGAILGPVAVLLVWVAPHGHCQTCHMPTQGWAIICPWCHENVNTVPSTALRPSRAVGQKPIPDRGTQAVAATSTLSPSSRAGPSVPSPTEPTTDPQHTHAMTKSPVSSPTLDVALPSAVRPASPVPEARPSPPDSGERVVVVARSPWVRRPDTERAPEPSVLATATYVTGTARLEPGQRYGIAIQGSRFQVLGPLNLEPKRIALERSVSDLQVSALDGRLVVSESGRSGFVLAFMSVAGAGLDDLAGAIRSAAWDAEP